MLTVSNVSLKEQSTISTPSFKNEDKTKVQRYHQNNLPLNKTDVRAYMYRGRFKNKEEFWADVEAKREARAAIKNKQKKINLSYNKDLGRRYAEIIPTKNVDKLKEIILKVVGEPSFYVVYKRAGSPEKTRYDGWYYGEQYSSKCTYSKHIHKFIIHAPRELRIDVDEFDDLYNVYCELIKETQGMKIYKASWVQKKRGFDFQIVKGYVAVKHGESFHADSIKAAIEGLKRKLKRIASKFNLTPDTIINVAAFRRITGACIPGCQNFLETHGLSENIKMTVKEAIELLKSKGQERYATLLEKAITC
ncbi:MAG: hypothetical protein GX892_07250 [Thermoanaerobacteraceae bacterium]|nr:hypothetical protein [Thermoanaerobacteraceae bacterium]